MPARRQAWRAGLGAISALLVAWVWLVTAPRAWAHGIGGRADLPLPPTLVAVGAGLAVLVSFVALFSVWPTSKFEPIAASRPMTQLVQRAAPYLGALARVFGLLAFALVLVTAAVGPTDSALNLAPTMVYVVFWVGLPIISGLIGDVWQVINPLDTLARGLERIHPRVGPDRAIPGAVGSPTVLDRVGQWPAALGLFAFVWLELVYPEPANPRLLAWLIGLYALFTLAACWHWGRRWLHHGGIFGAYFTLLAHMAPAYRDESGDLCLRWPLAGLAQLSIGTGTVALLMVALGSTTYDGLSRTVFWQERIAASFPTGAGRMLVGTLGLVATILVVAGLFGGAMQLAARSTGCDRSTLIRWFAPSLVPIVLAYAIAHYFSLLLFQGQAVIAQISDPLRLGWDLFGTATARIDYQWLSPRAIAWVQAQAIVLGHIAAVIVAHDRAVARLEGPQVAQSQYPLVAVMVLFTSIGLLLLMGA